MSVPARFRLKPRVATAAAQALDIQVPESGKEIARLTARRVVEWKYDAGQAGTAMWKTALTFWKKKISLRWRRSEEDGGELRVGILSNSDGTDSHERRPSMCW